jgi:hypothetical protein
MITMLIPISNGSPKRGAHSHVCSRISDLAHRSQTIDRLATSAVFCAELIDRRARKQFRRNGGQLSDGKIKRTAVRRLLRSQVFVCTLDSAPYSGVVERSREVRI